MPSEEPERPTDAWIRHATEESAKRKCVVCGASVAEVNSPKAICSVCARKKARPDPSY
jgi:hypothetical protein